MWLKDKNEYENTLVVQYDLFPIILMSFVKFMS